MSARVSPFRLLPDVGVYPRVHVYVIDRTDGVIKIGVTYSPRQRAGMHRTALGARLRRFHLGESFDCRSRAMWVERAACNALAAIGTRVSREEIAGVTFEQALAAVRYACRAERTHHAG